VLDPKERLQYLNSQADRLFVQLTGRTRKELLGKIIWEACPEVADSAFAREYHQAIHEQRLFELEIYYPGLDRWFDFLANPREDIRCCYFQDITERIRLERLLRQRLDQRTAAGRSRQRLTAHLAHAEAVRLLVIANTAEPVHRAALGVTDREYQIRKACNGAAALAEVRSWHPHVVLVDLDVPGLDEHEFADGLRQADSAGMLVVAALTSAADEEDRSPRSEAGFDFQIAKPVSSDDLRDLLAAINVSTPALPAAPLPPPRKMRTQA
jgi:CheY-like chemotaxis protein